MILGKRAAQHLRPDQIQAYLQVTRSETSMRTDGPYGETE